MTLVVENGAFRRTIIASALAGSGEMAELTRTHAWAGTDLGDFSGWPEALVTAVNLMLCSPFASAIYWGPEQILLYNDHYRPVLGSKHPQALGSTGADVWAEAWPLIEKPIRTAFVKGTAASATRQLIPILINGAMEDRWWTYGLSPIHKDGEVVGVFNSVFDNTAAVLAERKTSQVREELETVMESATLGMWHYDPQTGIVVADERMHRIFGSPAPDGDVDYWLRLLHPEDRDKVGEHFAGVLAGKHDYDLEYRILRDGEVRWLRSKGKAVGPKTNPEHIYAIVEDITDRKKADAALQQNEKLAAVGRLAGSMAHEINNPLAGVTNLLYLIQNSENLSDIRSYGETAERELRRVSLIANQTLRFHKQSTKPTPEFCYDLIGDSLAMFQGRLVNNKIIIEKRKRAEHPVECFGGEIRQVLNNLIGNAIDAMPFGGRLILRSREAMNYWTGRRGIVLTVADTGAGMSPEVCKRAFEAFYTTKGIGGTGLGLWVACEIIGRHHGTIRFRSSTAAGSSGTVFNVFLPFKS